MNLLALDLGTKTGYAYSGSDGKMIYGTWILAKPKEITFARRLRLDRRSDPRFLTLLNHLRRVHVEASLDYILFEDIQFASTTFAVQLWASFRAAVWLMAEYGIQSDCLPVGSLKKFASGNGAADKPAMARALVRQESRFRLASGGVVDTFTEEILDDNVVDAIHLHRWGRQNLNV